MAKPKAAELQHIPKPLRALAVRVGSLNPDPANARLHSERNLKAIEASLRRFGQYVPLVVQKQGRIIRIGNARHEVMERMGWEWCAALVVDESDVEATARAIADNRTAELAHWDDAALARTLDSLTTHMELEQVGFDQDELDELMAGLDPEGRRDETEIALGESLKDVEPELRISPELHERQDYIVVLFDNQFDWQVACDRLGIERVRCRKNGKSTIEQKGLGRVIRAQQLFAAMGME